MSEPKNFASLSPTLLARKGGAKPAMRPQLQPMNQFHDATARQVHDDLGWNDMGHEEHPGADFGHEEDQRISAEVVSLHDVEAARHNNPAVRAQQENLQRNVARSNKPRKSALSDGRRAAFTLRVDAERHLKLRLASTVLNQSAQQVVTEALDRFLAEMTELESLAKNVRKSR